MSTAPSIDRLREFIVDFISTYPETNKVTDWWRPPLLVTARADDRFDLLPRIAAPDHLLPEDLLPGAKSIIVYFIPFVEDLAARNLPGKFPHRDWAVAYNDTNTMIGRTNDALAEFLNQAGFKAEVTPPTANFDTVSLMSRWSHKHLGYLAGLGRFGLNSQLITTVGCTGRLGSLVSDAPLGDNPLTTMDEHCLAKRGFECRQCLDRCPVQALSVESGCDRKRCYTKLLTHLKRDNFKGLPPHSQVCGKCQVMLPCSFGVPQP